VRLPTTFRAREPRLAMRSGAAIALVCAVVLSVSTVFGPNSVSSTTRTASWVGAGVVGLLGLLALVIGPRALDRYGAFLAIGVGTVLLTAVLNVATSDHSAAGQAFYAFPVLWAASSLHRGAVVVITGLAVSGNLAALLFLLPAEDAVIDVVFFGAVLVVIAVMLDWAAVVQARLVAALEEQATVDALTGLVNRRVLEEALTHACTAPRGSRAPPWCSSTSTPSSRSTTGTATRWATTRSCTWPA
jgi:hypothetical protein